MPSTSNLALSSQLLFALMLLPWLGAQEPSLDETFGYRIERVVEGDSVNKVLGYVQYEKRDLIRRVRAAAEVALQKGDLQMEDCALLMKRFDEGLAGYTYLSRQQEPAVLIPRPVAPGSSAPEPGTAVKPATDRTSAKDPGSGVRRTPPAAS